MSDHRAAVARKLHPSQVRVSSQFSALLGYLLREQWTVPAIIELSVTVDGMLNVWSSDGGNALVGTLADLERNIRGLAKVAELTRDETEWLLAQIPEPGTSGEIRGAIITYSEN